MYCICVYVMNILTHFVKYCCFRNASMSQLLSLSTQDDTVSCIMMLSFYSGSQLTDGLYRLCCSVLPGGGSLFLIGASFSVSEWRSCSLSNNENTYSVWPLCCSAGRR